jgi:hypothetical protein
MACAPVQNNEGRWISISRQETEFVLRHPGLSLAHVIDCDGWFEVSGGLAAALFLRLSLPGLTRQSITFAKKLFAKKMDARVKPAHDDVCALRSGPLSRREQ